MNFVNFESSEIMDKDLIPYVIYNFTINKEREKIESYFIKNPRLLFSFVGFNGKLKLANQLASDKKCGCAYNIPWVTYYQKENNKKRLYLTFSQQIEEYRYMIKNWYPSNNISYMAYLSRIALQMILEIKQYFYYIQNNLNYCSLLKKKYYLDNFNSQVDFRKYYFLKISQNLPYK